jgi:hypothetical protein
VHPDGAAGEEHLLFGNHVTHFVKPDQESYGDTDHGDPKRSQNHHRHQALPIRRVSEKMEEQKKKQHKQSEDDSNQKYPTP